MVGVDSRLRKVQYSRRQIPFAQTNPVMRKQRPGFSFGGAKGNQRHGGQVPSAGVVSRLDVHRIGAARAGFVFVLLDGDGGSMNEGHVGRPCDDAKFFDGSLPNCCLIRLVHPHVAGGISRLDSSAVHGGDRRASGQHHAGDGEEGSHWVVSRQNESIDGGSDEGKESAGTTARRTAGSRSCVEQEGFAWRIQRPPCVPVAAKRPCAHPGCGLLVRGGEVYCAAHVSDRNIGRFADPHRGTRQARGYGADWERIRKVILARDKGLCQPCLSMRKYRPAKHVDHIVPKARGGTDDEGNLQAICVECHQQKTLREAKEARRGRP